MAAFARIIRHALGIAVAVAILAAAPAAPGRAQQGVENALGRLIGEMQTGRVDLRFFGPRARQVIVAQTNGTLVYPQLARLGPPVAIHLIAERRLPRGVVYGLRADFARASVNWELAYDRANVIEAYSFQFVAAPAAPGVPAPQFSPQFPAPQAPPAHQQQQQQQTTSTFSAPFPTPPQQLAAQPQQPQSQGAARPTGGTATGGSTDDACKLYPNLC